MRDCSSERDLCIIACAATERRRRFLRSIAPVHKQGLDIEHQLLVQLPPRIRPKGAARQLVIEASLGTPHHAERVREPGLGSCMLCLQGVVPCTQSGAFVGLGLPRLPVDLYLCLESPARLSGSPAGPLEAATAPPASAAAHGRVGSCPGARTLDQLAKRCYQSLLGAPRRQGRQRRHTAGKGGAR